MSFGIITSPKGGYRIIDSEISQYNTDNGFFCNEVIAGVFETTFSRRLTDSGSSNFGGGRYLRGMELNNPIRTHPVVQQLGNPGWRVWVPWNATIQGGLGLNIWATDALPASTPVKFFVTCPAPWSSYDNGISWGLQVRTANGATVYDSRRPIVQILHLVNPRRHANPVDSAANDVWVPAEANYVSQNECFIAGYSGSMTAESGALYRKGSTTAGWACSYRENYADWAWSPVTFGSETSAAMFARITI